VADRPLGLGPGNGVSPYPVFSFMQEPTKSERTTAARMHVGSVFAPILAPAVGYAVSPHRSPFVAAHSLRAVKEWLVLNVCLLVAAIASISYTAYRLWDLYQKDWQGFSITEFLLRFLIGYVLLAILGFVTMLVSFRQAWRAYRGDWPRGY
jgi:hypothetical protein